MDTNKIRKMKYILLPSEYDYKLSGVKEVIDEALGAYLKGKRIKPISNERR